MNILGLYAILGMNDDIDFHMLDTNDSGNMSQFLYTDKTMDPNLHMHCTFSTSTWNNTERSNITLNYVIKKIDNVIYTMKYPSWNNYGPSVPVKDVLTFGFPSPSNPVDVLHGWAKLHLIIYGDLLRDLTDSTSHDRYGGREKQQLQQAHDLFKRRLEIATLNFEHNFVADVVIGGSYNDMVESTKYLIANDCTYKLPASLKHLNRKNIEKMVASSPANQYWLCSVRMLYPEMFEKTIVAPPKRAIKSKEEKEEITA